MSMHAVIVMDGTGQAGGQGSGLRRRTEYFFTPPAPMTG